MNQAGLYFHIPFCRSKCPYCDFFSVKYDSASAERYVSRLCKEIRQYNGAFDTVYFGGGTPSMLEPELIGKIIKAARNQFEIASDAEITVECNPSKNLERDFELYKSFGVNRISIGMQSARNEERFALGRLAGQSEVAKAVTDARNAGIYNISLDLMLGTPKQSLSSLDYSFEFIEKMNVPHISAYMLKIEEGTRFFEIKDRLLLPDDDIVGEMYLKTVSTLQSMGFNQYEISNFSKIGFESRHNLKYWNLADYLGIGTSAHSFWQGRRFYYDNAFNIVEDGDGGDAEEQIMLGLRLTKGIKKSLVKKDLTPYINAGYMVEKDENIAFTSKGFLVSNTIIADII
ncbi:MAG: radical SAM family heme chaperone HemW [Acetobacter sp.]|nr:radical SAM family heme chaperone HemW [Bacteroides sp.]MCM1341303.1 radical SAM family heme chaperone HemW [Acetobacter sp.]MCM1433921.1 radical SAM family heme chaperone HemW [Clostridiales bacterium]